jgi:hypothetical protein
MRSFLPLSDYLKDELISEVFEVGWNVEGVLGRIYPVPVSSYYRKIYRRN